MELKLNFPFPSSDIQFSYQEEILFLGSCFTDEIGAKMKGAGFNVVSNPFGTLFHPDAILNVINSSLDCSQDVNVYNRDDIYFSWDSASSVYGMSEEEIRKVVLAKRDLLLDRLNRVSVLVLTFGSAWSYVHKELGITVGNCHKVSQSNFEKVLTSQNDLHTKWHALVTKLQLLNPKLRIVCTVSPVRHIKDGLIENNRSKARLIELTHSLSKIKGVYYFPSYEIIIDELRDYRFYASDRVHPSEEAVAYVWQRFADFFLSKETMKVLEEYRLLKKQLNHRSLHPESQADQKRLSVLNQKKEAFLKKYPEIYWE